LFVVFIILAAPLQQLAARIYENGGVIGAVCHGTIALGNIRLSNGQYLIHDRKVTGQQKYMKQIKSVCTGHFCTMY
jgi:putative intracellular protease/amidase